MCRARAFAARDHRNGNRAGFGERVVIRNEIDVPIGHAAITFHLIEDTHGEGMTLLAVEDKESRFRQDELRLHERVVSTELTNEPGEIVRVPSGSFGIDDGLAFERPHVWASRLSGPDSGGPHLHGRRKAACIYVHVMFF